ncbi:MAG: alpha/beta hydrolase family protein [Candidatus Thorarchaeota archaeon]
MNKRPVYFSLLIFSILIASSFYMSWSADTGLGELDVERHSIIVETGREIHYMVYKPRTSNYPGPMPVVLTTHGIAGSKAGMYSFNIELARRNFTVVSVDLPGHGDSPLPFNITDLDAMALDCYTALRHVQNTYPGVDNESYGVVTHSLGYQVAVAMTKLPIAPFAYVAVGYLSEMGLGDIEVVPGNLMIAIGELDEMISVEAATESLRSASGIEDAEPGITYGSFENQTAFRLDLSPTDHVFEAIDGGIVAASTTWMVQAMQGMEQFERTIAPREQVYVVKTVAMAVGVFSLLVSTIPVLIIVQSSVPDKLKPRKLPNDTSPHSFKKTFITSSVIGIAIILAFTAGSAITFHLENLGIAWPNSMFATGVLIFFVMSALAIPVLLMVSIGKTGTSTAFASLGFKRSESNEFSRDLLRSSFVAGIGIIWLMGWMALGGIPDTMTPWIIFSMVRYPVGIRVLNIAILMFFAVLYFAADAAWIRGYILSKREWVGERVFTKNMVLGFSARLAAAGGLSVLVVQLSTIFGFIAGPMVLLGLLLLLYMIISTITTILISWSSIQMENPWPAVILSAFLLSWVVISSIPLI